jgi:membrane fusion protein
MDGGGHGAGEDAAGGLPLFRPEVLQERQSQWLGAILLRPRAVHYWFAACAALTVAALVAALCLASYTRKARVSGWLVPAQGMVRVFAPRAAIATRLLVREGDQVSQGQVLVALSTEEESAALGATQARAARELALQRASLNADGVRTGQLFRQQRATLEDRLGAMRLEQQNMEQEIVLQKSRLALARQAEARLRELQAGGYIPEQQLRAASEAALDQAARLQALERSLITLGRERATLEDELRDLPLKMAEQGALIARGVAAAGRELAEVEARRALLIAAPQAGTVTAIHAGTGAAVNPGTPLLSIVPRGAQLEAHLYAPSRSVGFVRAGQQVLLRYRAYPYQKFGHYRGVIASVSRTAIEPAEVPAAFALAAAGSVPEPMYRITVTLERQDVTAYGERLPLQSGMQLDADILLERRRLYEWALDPVFTLTGGWNR